MIRIVFLAMLILTVFCQPAWANNPPGPGSLLAEVAILPVMILLTALGGGYAYMRDRKKGGVLASFAAVGAIFLSMINEGIPFVVGGIFALVALQRAGALISWGVKTRKVAAEFGPSIPPKGLIVSGVLLLFITLFLYSILAVVSVIQFQSHFGQRKERLLLDLTAWRMAYLLEASSSPDYATSINPPDYEDVVEKMKSVGYELADEPQGGNGGFKLYLTPSRTVFFPYNYFTSYESYLADHTGKIRKTQVHWPGRRCPEDADVIVEVETEDLESALGKMKAGWGVMQ